MSVHSPGVIVVQTKRHAARTRSEILPRPPHTDRPPRASSPAWRRFLIGSLFGAGLYFVLPPGGVAQGAILTAFGLASAVAVVAGVRMNRPSSRRPVWYFMAAGLGVYTVALLLWFPIGVHIQLGFPSVANGLFLCSYMLLAAG